MPEPALEVSGLCRFFGGLAAVSDVSLDLVHGEVHAVIGPNGAGKTTLINLLSGELAPSSGSIRYAGQEIAGLPPHRIARLGIARSYQRTNIFREFSAFENCRLAAQARLPTSMRFFRPALGHPTLADAAERALALVGLDRPMRIAETLSHGEQRQLEIAMTLATEPKVLLLDEPLAGMGTEESVRMVALIGRLAAGHAVLLVEHDVDAVFSIADRLTVMVNGRVLESGDPAAIRASAQVQEAYLGSAEPVP
jgi:branched-chain amino acid transport system ATP-binding protein